MFLREVFSQSANIVMMSLKKNVLYNIVLTVSQFIFPLITFPYVTRILGPANLGAVNFVQSFVQYFILFALLGILIYGQREIAVCQKDLHQRSVVFINIVTVHLLMTLFCCMVYVGCIFFLPYLHSYLPLLGIGLIYLLINPFTLEWFFIGMEDFRFITLRTLFVRLLLLVSIFIFVKSSKDLYLYYFLTVLSFVLPAILNVFYALPLIQLKRSYITLKSLKETFCQLKNCSAYTLLTGVYMLFPVIILGFIQTDVAVGNYTVAEKIFRMILSIFSAISAVLLPRMTALYQSERAKFQLMIETMLHLFIPISVFLTVGVFLASHEIILFFSGPAYDTAGDALRLFSILLLFVPLAQVFVLQALFPMRKEREILKISFVSAICGTILNFLLVPFFSLMGSVLAVCFSEIFVTVFTGRLTFSIIGGVFPIKLMLKNLVYAMSLLPVYVLIKGCIHNNLYLLILFSSFAAALLFMLIWIQRKRIFKLEI